MQLCNVLGFRYRNPILCDHITLASIMEGRTAVWVVVVSLLFLLHTHGLPRIGRRLRMLELRFRRDSLALHESIQELWDAFESHTNTCSGIGSSSNQADSEKSGLSDQNKNTIEAMNRLANNLKVAFNDEKQHLREMIEAMKEEVDNQKECIQDTLKDAFATVTKGMLLLGKAVEDTNTKVDRLFDISVMQEDEMELINRIPVIEKSVDKVKDYTLAQMESEQRANENACAGEDGQYCDQRLKHHRSCADVQKTYPNTKSGVYTLYTDTNNPFSVFCVFREGYGYTYLSPTTAVDVNINDLHDDRSHVLIRFADRAGAQYESRFEQLAKYKHLPLSIQFNSHNGYNGVANSHMSPYLYVGLLPRIGINHRGDVQGYKVNGHDVTFTNCDGNPNSYFTMLFNVALAQPRHQGGQTAMMNQLFDRAVAVPAKDKIPSQYLSAFELHFGGCGGLAASTKYPNRPLAAIGMRYDVKCPVPAEIPHGKLSVTNGNLFGSIVTYVCDDGYKAIYGDVRRNCSATGRWSGALPMCG